MHCMHGTNEKRYIPVYILEYYFMGSIPGWYLYWSVFSWASCVGRTNGSTSLLAAAAEPAARHGRARQSSSCRRSTDKEPGAPPRDDRNRADGQLPGLSCQGHPPSSSLGDCSDGQVYLIGSMVSGIDVAGDGHQPGALAQSSTCQCTARCAEPLDSTTSSTAQPVSAQPVGVAALGVCQDGA